MLVTGCGGRRAVVPGETLNRTGRYLRAVTEESAPAVDAGVSQRQ
jgi:hypothetical protein